MIPIKNSVPTRNPAVVTWCLILVNCVVFFMQLRLSPAQEEQFLVTFALIPALYFAPPPVGLASPSPLDYLPFITNTFLHGGWLHLIANMWTLWMFGPAVEDRLGYGRYLVFYLFCGVLASVTHAVFNADSTVPALGASGAIAGVLGCFLRLFPMSRVVVLVPIVFIPLFFEIYAFVFAGIWFLMQVLQGAAELFSQPQGGGVAWWAHIGGFVAGLVLGSLWTPPRQGYRPYYADEGVMGFHPNGRR